METILALLIPVFFLIAHGVLKSRKLALWGQISYGLFLSVLSVYILFTEVESVFVGPDLIVWGGLLRLSPSLSIQSANSVLLLMLGLVLVFSSIWLRESLLNASRSFLIPAWVTIGGLVGAFLASTLVTFYVFFEVSLIGAYFWIGLHGNRETLRSLYRFVLFTLVGSLSMLASILMILSVTGSDVPFVEIKSVLQSMNSQQRFFTFLGFILGLGIKTPLFLLHGWMQETYPIAPDYARAVISSSMSKLGAYGLLVIVAPNFSEQIKFAAPILLPVAVIGVIYGGLLSLTRTRLMDVFIFASLSHLNLIVLGIFLKPFLAQSSVLSASLFQMLNHGLIVAAMFVLLARLPQEHLEIGRVAGLRSQYGRIAALLFAILLAGISLPGFSSFAAELVILSAVFRVSPWLSFFAALGLLISAGAVIRAFHRIFLGDVNHTFPQQDFKVKDTAVGIALIAIWILLGIFPMWIIAPIAKTLERL